MVEHYFVHRGNNIIGSLDRNLVSGSISKELLYHICPKYFTIWFHTYYDNIYIIMCHFVLPECYLRN